MKKQFLAAVLLFVTTMSAYAVETTITGKIVSVYTRSWGMHVQTDFSGGATLGCGVQAGDQYMYDFRLDNPHDNGNNDFAQSLLLSAFVTGRDVKFNLYSCNSTGNRPVIGHILLY